MKLGGGEKKKELPLMNTVRLQDYRAIWLCFQIEGDKVKADSLARSARLVHTAASIRVCRQKVLARGDCPPFSLFHFDFTQVMSTRFLVCVFPHFWHSWTRSWLLVDIQCPVNLGHQHNYSVCSIWGWSSCQMHFQTQPSTLCTMTGMSNVG